MIRLQEIWKFPIEIKEGKHNLFMPDSAEILTVVEQDKKAAVYALVNPNAKNQGQRRDFQLFLTGDVVDGDFKRKYIGTFRVKALPQDLVFHLFEIF